MKINVYLIDLHKSNELSHHLLSDDEFIKIAKKSGFIYDIVLFSEMYNNGALNDLFVHSVIRIISE